MSITLTLTLPNAEAAKRLLDLAASFDQPIETPTQVQPTPTALAPVYQQPASVPYSPPAPTQSYAPPAAQPYAQSTAQVAPLATPAALPTAAPATYTVAQLQQACAPIIDAGRQQELVALLQSFGVQALTQLPEARLGEFATALRGLGAKL